MTATINEVRFLAGRSLRHIPRIPEKAFGAVLLPLVFVLLFAYVFGSAIQVPGGGNYHAYLVSGIFAQTMIGTLPDVFTLQHPIITSFLWAGAIMAVFVPLSIRRYQRMGK